MIEIILLIGSPCLLLLLYFWGKYKYKRDIEMSGLPEDEYNLAFRLWQQIGRVNKPIIITYFHYWKKQKFLSYTDVQILKGWGVKSLQYTVLYTYEDLLKILDVWVRQTR